MIGGITSSSLFILLLRLMRYEALDVGLDLAC